MGIIRPATNAEQCAALKARSLITDIFSDVRTWTCRECGAQTSVFDEICSGCGREDVEQGQGMPDALTYIKTKFDLDLHQRRMPVEIPNTNRVSLARLFYLLGHTKGVEVGVERGLYSEVLLRENPLLHLTCVDAWTPHFGYRDHVDAAKLQRFYVEAQDRLSKFPSRVAFVRAFSVEAAAQMPDRSLDFVYIDANHNLQSVIADLAAWAPKVRVGGIVAGHDFLKAKLPSLMHVPQAVHAWTDAYEIAPWFVLGRREKVEGELRDDGRSWFYVVPEPIGRKGVIKQ